MMGGVRTDPRIGKTIGDYVVTKLLAAGGMGSVYIAENVPSGLTVVVKFMLAEFVANSDVRARFETECRAAVKLQGHTNIVDIRSYGERDGELYMVMEHLRGENLADHLQRHPRISKPHAFRLVSQICNALHALHGSGIVHRDLKPANIFVVPTDQEAYRVKLIDFGIVHDRTGAAERPRTRAGAMIGTPGYMALEQFGGQAPVTPAADVFALAVIIWEMFTGVVPWSAPNEFALFERQKGEPPDLPAGHRLPPGWEPILRQALSPKPTDRPPLHALLFALARDLPPDPPVESGFEMVTRYASRVLQNTPVEVETVRASDAHRAQGAYWAMQRATHAPGATPITPWSSADHIPLSDPDPRSGPASAATVHERPGSAVPVVANSTTLSHSAGVSQPRTPESEAVPRPNRRPIAFAILAVVVIGAVGVTLGLRRRSEQRAASAATTTRSTAPAPDASLAPSAPTSTAATSPSPAPDAGAATRTDASAVAPSAPTDAGAPVAATLDAGALVPGDVPPRAPVASTARTTRPTRVERTPKRTGKDAGVGSAAQDQRSGPIDPDGLAE